ncbi:hypothetical protein ACJRO7_031186 [Eucalyptus globulus]|uniref:Uncharacterized protein n=1 Tax=Eucalyptus globulus TaxID=34317 RepID=A0ABD3JFV5_EUCGL
MASKGGFFFTALNLALVVLLASDGIGRCEAARNLLQLPNIPNLTTLSGGTLPHSCHSQGVTFTPISGAMFPPLPGAMFPGVTFPPLPSFFQISSFLTTTSVPFLPLPCSTYSTSP